MWHGTNSSVTGRYEGVNEEDRLCQLCDQLTVESDMYVILVCPMYNTLHRELFGNATMVETDFYQLNDMDKHFFYSRFQIYVFKLPKPAFTFYHIKEICCIEINIV